ncbi:MAG TPA: HAD-IIA family hydrolase [Clostridia bacterium]|nr:HAD-IIA family hydrolase [Clostridia bacterium]
MTDKTIFTKTKTFIIDMDGTFYLDDGLIEGATDFIDRLKDTGRDFCFFTNNSSNNVDSCVKKLAAMGYAAPKDKIIISSHVTIDYLKKHQPGKSVFLLGNELLEADFRQAGIHLVKEKPDIVVLGFDTTLTYQKMWDAVRFIDGGATYIATHPDLNCPTANGYMPDTGSMIELFAASTGKRPIIMGKPMTATVDYMTGLLSCTRDELAFVGDRLATDIAIGVNHGIPTALVLTGVTTRAQSEESPIHADVVVERLSALCEYL